MATTRLKTDPKQQMGNTPWGNRVAFRFVLSTDASGRVLGADRLADFKTGDKVVLGMLPEGLRILDSQVLVTTALTAATTGKLGFEYADGIDNATAPQDDDYFGAALALNAAARLRNATTNATVLLPKPAHVTLVLGGADNAKSGRVEIIIEGVFEG